MFNNLLINIILNSELKALEPPAKSEHLDHLPKKGVQLPNYKTVRECFREGYSFDF